VAAARLRPGPLELVLEDGPVEVGGEEVDEGRDADDLAVDAAAQREGAVQLDHAHGRARRRQAAAAAELEDHVALAHLVMASLSAYVAGV